MPTGPKHRGRDRRRQETAIRQRARASSSERGYGRRWQRYREYFLRNVEPLCRRCRAEGRSEQATDVDHITPVTGPDDPLFWETSNHQGLCHSHHSRKTATEDRSRGRGQRGAERTS